MAMLFPSPLPMVAHAHSPTPSIVRIADCSNGEAKNAEAACERWCSANRIFFCETPTFLAMVSLIHNFEVNTFFNPCEKYKGANGNVERLVLKMRSNLRKGFS